MAVDTSKIQIDPYTSTVPLVQIPPEQMQPAQPLAGQFGKKGTPALAVGDALLKGFMEGHAQKEKANNAKAQATITAADSATQAAYEKYQDSLSQAGGKVDDPTAKAAYDAYLGIFNQAKEAKAQFVIPQKGDKGQKSGGKDGKSKTTGFGNIKEFFAANPHIIPQIALMTMQPKGPGQSRESRLQDAQVKAAEGEVGVQQEQLAGLKEQRTRETETYNHQQQQQAVEQAGGVDAVLNDKKADPKLQQVAREIKYSALDKESPEAKMKMGFIQDIQSGQSKNWTPEQRVLAGSFGVIPQPQVQTITGKNGHQQQILVDPTTNQPVPGSKPLDLGPPAWAQEFYAKRAADKGDLQRAVKGDPTAYGITLTGDPKTDKAAIDARAEQLYVRSEFGIQSLSDKLGKTGYEVQRDNDILTDVVKASGLNAKNSPLDSGQATMSYADGKPFAVGRDYFGKILNKFSTSSAENGGVRAFRDTPLNPDNNPPEVLEAERKFMYQWVKGQMVTQKGKNAVTDAQADAILKTTALGRPITSAVSKGGGMTRPPEAPQVQQHGIDPSTGLPRAAGMQRPPGMAGATKLYSVPGYIDPVELTDEEAQKAKAANIPVTEVSSDVLSQFSQQ